MSLLLDIKVTTSACFLDLFAWTIFFQFFILRQYLSFMWRCVSWMEQKNGSHFCTHSVSLFLFMGELEIIDIERFIDFCYFIDGGSCGLCICMCMCVCFFFCFAAGVKLFTSCIFMGIVNLLSLAFSF